MEVFMGARQAKLLKVAANGQISIGKSWAGRQIRVEEVSDSEIRISSGVFIADSQKTFFTDESVQALNEFESWLDQNPATNESAQETLKRIRKQRLARGK